MMHIDIGWQECESGKQSGSLAFGAGLGRVASEIQYSS